MYKANLIRLLTTVSFIVMLATPLSAQEKEDSLTFRFVSAKDMFFSPYRTNADELARLFEYVDRHKEHILSHDIMLYVNGYCISKGSRAENLAIAKIRSNRVKSELITRKGLREDCYVTRNHSEKGDFVTVSIVFCNKDIEPVAAQVNLEPEKPAETPVTQEVTKPAEPVSAQETPEAAEPAETPAIQEVTEPEEPEEPVAESREEYARADADDRAEAADTSALQQGVAGVPDVPGNLYAVKSDSRIALKTNIPAYAILMPNAELEWKFADRWSAALEVQGAWYAIEDPRKVYRLAAVTPELRYWVIDRSMWHGMYVGVFGGAGLYDLYFSDNAKGHEGEGAMAGLSAGYMWPIGKSLSIDAGLGVGYMRAVDKVYVPLDGHFLYQMTKNINYVGPLRLRLSLVWRIQSVRKR